MFHGYSPPVLCNAPATKLIGAIAGASLLFRLLGEICGNNEQDNRKRQLFRYAIPARR